MATGLPHAGSGSSHSTFGEGKEYTRSPRRPCDGDRGPSMQAAVKEGQAGAASLRRPASRPAGGPIERLGGGNMWTTCLRRANEIIGAFVSTLGFIGARGREGEVGKWFFRVPQTRHGCRCGGVERGRRQRFGDETWRARRTTASVAGPGVLRIRASPGVPPLRGQHGRQSRRARAAREGAGCS